MLELCFLANLCNSIIIEVYCDINQVSHGFEYCQSLGFIAVKRNGGPSGASLSGASRCDARVSSADPHPETANPRTSQ